MAFSNQAKHSVYYHYSPTYQYSVGVEGVRNRISGDEHSYVRLTYLLNLSLIHISEPTRPY